MCISSNWVNDAQDSIAVKKFRDFPNSLIPTGQGAQNDGRQGSDADSAFTGNGPDFNNDNLVEMLLIKQLRA